MTRSRCVQVCDAVQACPGLPEELLQVLDQFQETGVLETLYARLSCVLRPWPQLLRDFAAFLNPGQARRCGLVGDITDATWPQTDGVLTLLLWFSSISCWSSSSSNAVGASCGGWSRTWEKAPPSTIRWCWCFRKTPPPQLRTWKR